MLTSLKEIQAYIEECEQKRLDLDNKEVWSKVYLPATRTTEVWINYEGKVVFKSVQIKLVALNRPLMVFRLLPDWFRKRHCIYDIDKFDENLCVWRCLTIYKRLTCGETNQVSKRNCDAAKNLAHKYYGDKKLKKRVVSPKNLDFEGIAGHHNVSIMLYEPRKDRGEGCRIRMTVSLW